MNPSTRTDTVTNHWLGLARFRRYARQTAIRTLCAIAVATGLLAPGLASAQTCGPGPAGPPLTCSGSSVASTSSADGVDAGAGNPINVMTGNKYQREDDMPALPGVLGLEIVRHYNSAFSKPGTRNGPIGRGWKLSYETEIFDHGSKIQVLQADGGRVIFDHDQKNPSLCSTQNPANGVIRLDRKPNGLVEYMWTWTNGRRLHFNSWGKLDRIIAPTGETVDLYYDSANVLVRVVDPQGRSMDLVYLDKEQSKANDRFRGVQFIDSPVGRFAYEYGSTLPQGAGLFDKHQLLANLVRVRLPTAYSADNKAHPLTSRGTTTSSISRIYHHENAQFPWLMTGISVEAPGPDGKPATTRFATYGYDNNGLANLSTHANNVDKVTLDFRDGSETILTNSLGQQTVYRRAIIGGEHRMLEVRGAGCSTCGEPNIRYAYDAVGQLIETTKLSTNGDPVSTTKTERDKFGRPVRLSRVVYEKGKPGPVQSLLRFEYQGDRRAPALIARPSVVPGFEIQTRIQFNDAGQPLSVTETGWVPTLDSKRAAAKIERTITYAYAVLNGHSVLTRIDGPLPNGKTNSPIDSDVTVFEYDNRTDTGTAPNAPSKPGELEKFDRREGLLTRIIAPGNLITDVLERDSALRPTKLQVTDGDIVQVTTVGANWHGAPVDIEMAAGTLRRHLHYDYNADGQVAAVTQPGNLRSSFQYDPAGRMNRLILPDGSGVAIAHDTEDRTATLARFGDLESPAAQALSLSHFDYDKPSDKPSQLAKISDVLGVIKSYRYSDVGQIVSLSNALGNVTAFSFDANGRLISRTDAAGSPDAAEVRQTFDNLGRATRITAPNGVDTLRLFDDFGRKVFESDPDHGSQLFRYDLAGRLIARIDETLAATRYSYDHANRLLAMGVDKQPNLLQYQYRGQQLVSMVSTTDGTLAHATERTEYKRDAMGQVVQETHWLASVDAQPHASGTPPPGLRFVTTNQYDDAGRLVRQTLPDSHVLQYRFASGAGGAPNERARHKPGQLEAILFDDSVIVTEIEQTVVGGLTGYTMSNGMRQKISLDGRGRIEQLRTLSSDEAHSAGWWEHLKAWFSPSKAAGGAELYRQANRYDDAGRIIQINRQLAAPAPGGASALRREGYAYDRLNRLTSIVSSDGPGSYFVYDKAGNRIAESAEPADGGMLRTATQAPHPTERRYSYAEGSNRLIISTQGDVAPTLAQSMRSAWYYHPTGVPLAQFQWPNKGTSTNRRTVYNLDRRPVAVYENDVLVARYHYNSRGERIAKTVYPVGAAGTSMVHVSSRTPPRGETTYSLYRDQRLAAETDGAGNITTHYVYLYGKPVAKIDMAANMSSTHRFWKALTMRSESDSSDTVAEIYAIVTDHLGTPQEVMDENQQVVWQAVTAAFGQARITYASTRANSKPFEMTLRLPGQVFDAETKLNYNYLRDYDPSLGRYTAPDPVGVGGGTNPYAYVSNNPLTNVDPLGLYQIDVHYYMTYFLAIAAGVDKDVAQRIALATEYIDDNPVTEPMKPGTSVWDYWDSTLINQPALVRYHFVEAGFDDPQRASESAADYAARRIENPNSPQLARLLAASTTAKTDPNATCNSSNQLFGEYLHAFEDSFAHRDNNNAPYAATIWGVGTGHFLDGENPDYTYNHLAPTLGLSLFWNTNESRTFEMEKEVFTKMKSLSSSANTQYSLSSIKYTLDTFNRFHANAGSANFVDKIAILNKGLSDLHYEGIDITYSPDNNATNDGYNVDTAKKNRDDALNRLKPSDYVGTILPQGTAPLPSTRK